MYEWDVLREALRTGVYRLFDESETLKSRATKRERLQRMKEGKADGQKKHIREPVFF